MLIPLRLILKQPTKSSKAQLDCYQEELPNDIKQLSEFTTRKQAADFAGFIVYNDKGEEVFYLWQT